MKFRDPVSFAYRIVCFLLVSGLLLSCGPTKINPDYIYFQHGADIVNVQQKDRIIQPGDLLTIQVYSKTLNQDQVVIFNIPPSSGSSSAINTVGAGTVSSAGGAPSYQVNAAGKIEVPVIGTVEAAGLTKDGLKEELLPKLTNYVKNPGVIIRFQQFNINVLGEVRAPGTKVFNSDKVSIIDAISAAGDLTETGRREDITLIREVDNKRRYFTVDLRDKGLFDSPLYQLQSNDIIYVKPNNIKLKTLSVDPEAQRRLNLILTISGFFLGIASFVISIIR